MIQHTEYTDGSRKENSRGKRGNGMKILYTGEVMKAIRRAAVRLGIIVPGLLLCMWILPIFMYVPRFLNITFMFTMIYCIYRTGIFPCTKIYCTHWIKYGNGRVIIKRVRKEYVNGRPAGKWKKEEEEFLLEDLDSCGISMSVLEEYVEFNPIMKNGISKECFFQLKNGKRLGCEMKFYLPEQMEELFRYIYDETGIEFQETSKSVLKTERISDSGKAEED